jgi:uncharacterized membrane protein required for colicin V production
VLDFLIGSAFAALAVRGWFRGLVREFFDLVGLLVGAVAGLRFAEPAGAFLETWSGVTPGTARIIGGIAIFVLVGIAASIAAHFAGRAMAMPGFGLTNRVGGAILAAGWGWVLATIIFSLLSLAPLPERWQSIVDESRVVEALSEPNQPVQVALRRLSDDRSLQAALGIDGLLGGENVVLDPDETFEIEPAEPDELERRPELEREDVQLVNTERIAAGIDPLTSNPALADVAAAYAAEMALGGFFGHTNPDGATVSDRVREAGINFIVVGENLALAATLESAHDGLMASDGHRANILSGSFTEVGVGAVEGPLGIMVVQVFTG